MLCLMLDTQTRPVSITNDASDGPYPRITDAAIERAKTRLGIDDTGTLGIALGFSRQSFWRLRRGQLDVRYSDVLRVADKLGWAPARVFECGRRD
jgi:hypothetical protein